MAWCGYRYGGKERDSADTREIEVRMVLQNRPASDCKIMRRIRCYFQSYTVVTFNR